MNTESSLQPRPANAAHAQCSDVVLALSEMVAELAQKLHNREHVAGDWKACQNAYCIAISFKGRALLGRFAEGRDEGTPR